MAADKIKEYSTDELTVVWQPSKCIHSEKCWRGLSSVFDPKARPWINVEGADSETLRNQIDQCPSGALSYRVAGEQSETMNEEIIVEPVLNGPLLVYGNLTVKNKDGEESQHHKVTAFCRCGASSNKPYCDGTHQKIGFEG